MSYSNSRLCIALTLGALLLACGGGASDSNPGDIVKPAAGNIKLTKISPNVGNSGDLVTIFGKGLDAENLKSVFFGERQALIIDYHAEGTQVDVQVPAQPQGFGNPATLVAYAKNGDSDQLNNGFAYVQNDDCSASGVAPQIQSIDDVNILAGLALYVHGANFQVGALVNVNGTPLIIQSVTGDEIVAMLPSDADSLCASLPCTLPALVANPNGCSVSGDFLLDHHGLPYAATFPALGEIALGTDLVALGQDIDGDNIKDFAALSQENINVFTPNPAAANQRIWASKITEVAQKVGVQSKCKPLNIATTYNSILDNVGDLNNDGVVELAISQRSGDATKRYNCLISADGTQAELIQKSLTNSLWGVAITGVNDLNADQKRDLLVAGKFYMDVTPVPGEINIYSGSNYFDGNDSNNNNELKSFTSASGEKADGFGNSIVTLGDLNADGQDEVFIGAYARNLNPPAVTKDGAVYVYSMQSVLATAGSGLVVPPYIRRILPQTGDTLFGAALQRVTDLDGDGSPDLLVAARSGVVYGYSGKDAADPAVSQLEPLFRLVVPNTANYVSLGDAGDVNGDGKNDIILGSASYSGSAALAGRVFVYSGAIGAGTLPELFAYDGPGPNDILGTSVAGIGDVNGDGVAEVIAGMPQTPYANSAVLLFNMYAPAAIYPPYN